MKIIENLEYAVKETDTYYKYNDKIIEVNGKIYKVRIHCHHDDAYLGIELVDINSWENYRDRFSIIDGEDETNRLIEMAREIKQNVIQDIVKSMENEE